MLKYFKIVIFCYKSVIAEIITDNNFYFWSKGMSLNILNLDNFSVLELCQSLTGSNILCIASCMFFDLISFLLGVINLVPQPIVSLGLFRFTASSTLFL